MGELDSASRPDKFPDTSTKFNKPFIQSQTRIPRHPPFISPPGKPALCPITVRLFTLTYVVNPTLTVV